MGSRAPKCGTLESRTEMGMKPERRDAWRREGFLHSLVFFLIIFLHTDLSHHNFPASNTHTALMQFCLQGQHFPGTKSVWPGVISLINPHIPQLEIRSLKYKYLNQFELRVMISYSFLCGRRSGVRGQEVTGPRGRECDLIQSHNLSADLRCSFPSEDSQRKAGLAVLWGCTPTNYNSNYQ